MNTMEKEVSEVLGGYAKANPESLLRMAESNDWRALAVWEATRRAARLLELFDDQTLKSIAAGEIDMQALCREAATSQRVVT
jgi:hypothetical protein